MPIYEFRCAKCGNIEEFILTGSQPVEMKCGACGGEELERVLSATNYAVGSSGSASAGPSATSRSCGHGRSCTSLQLPGHTK